MENIKEKPKHIKGYYGITILPAICILPTYHPCYGCVWYDRNADILFCPFHNCVRNKKGFEAPKKKEAEKMLIKTRRYILRRFESRCRFGARRYTSCAGRTE